MLRKFLRAAVGKQSTSTEKQAPVSRQSRPRAESPKFKHYTDAVDTIRTLKRDGEYEKLEEVLMRCIEATESEAKAEGFGVAPFCYEEFAKLCRKRKDYQAEVAILERFAKQPHAPGVKPKKLLERLQRARELASKASS